MGVLVHRQLAGADDGLLVGLHGAAQDRLDAGDDLVEAERLGDVVVAAGVQARDLVLGLVLGGEEEDRRGVAGAAQPLRDAEAVHVGEHDVEDDEVGLFLEHGRDRLGAVGDGPDLESGESQARDEQVADVRLVVDDQDARCGHALIMATEPMRCLDIGRSGTDQSMLARTARSMTGRISASGSTVRRWNARPSPAAMSALAACSGCACADALPSSAIVHSTYSRRCTRSGRQQLRVAGTLQEEGVAGAGARRERPRLDGDHLGERVDQLIGRLDRRHLAARRSRHVRSRRATRRLRRRARRACGTSSTSNPSAAPPARRRARG